MGGLRTDLGQGGLDQEEFGMPAYAQSPMPQTKVLEGRPLIAKVVDDDSESKIL